MLWSRLARFPAFFVLVVRVLVFDLGSCGLFSCCGSYWCSLRLVLRSGVVYSPVRWGSYSGPLWFILPSVVTGVLGQCWLLF